MTEKHRRFDPAEFLETEEDFAVFLQDSADSGDPKVLVAAIGVIARARGMTEIAQRVGISRQGLFKALSDAGNPSFDNVGKILDVLGYRIQVVPKVVDARSKRGTPRATGARATRTVTARPSRSREPV